MPQVLAAVLVSIGVSAVAATIISTAVFFLAAKLLTGGGSKKVEPSERAVKQPKPPRIHVLGARRVFGSQMLFANGPDGSTVDVWAYCEGPVHAVTSAYINDDALILSGGYVLATSDSAYGGSNVKAGWNTGANPGTAHAAVVSAVADWTSDHRGDGIVSGYMIKRPVKAEDFLTVYPQGDNVTMSLVVEGHFCHDPRDPGSDPTDPTTWPYSDNSALLHLWFYMVYKGYDYAEKIAPVEGLWIDAANICDEAMSLDAGGTEPKYSGCIMFDTTMEPSAIEDEIRATYDGWTAPDENGCIKVYAGKLYTPTVTITAADIIDYSLSEFVEHENYVNEIIVRHVSAAHDYNEVEPEPWRDESDITARGRVNSTGVDLQVPSHTQARRLAKRRMARNNAPYKGSVRVLFSSRAALYERYINLTIVDAGTTFFDGMVEVVGGERDYESGGATIEWVAIDENVDSWNAATEDGEPAPTQTKFYLAPLDTPTVSTATATLDSTGTAARIALDMDSITVTGVTWFTRWREAGDVSWLVEEQSTTGTVLITGQVPVDTNIEVSASYKSADGRRSDWSATETVSTATASLAPSAVTAFSAADGAGSSAVTWRNSTSSNFAYVKLYRGTSTSFGSASQIGSNITGGLGEVKTVTDTVGAGTYYYWVRPYSTAAVAGSLVGPDAATVT